ncbi:MAG: hypothetical protein R3247_14700 [Rhodothermales bacterium]|nr:hypothetical protein [Rhodothermales bacterium]
MATPQHTFRVGPAVILTAPTIEAPASEWVHAGYTQGEVSVAPELGVSLVHADQAAGPVDARGTWQASLQANLLARDVADLSALVPGAVLSGGALGFRGASSQLAPRAWAIVPEDEYEEGVPWLASESAMWVRRGVLEVLGPITIRQHRPGPVEPGWQIAIRSLSGSPRLYLGQVHTLGIKALGLEQFLRPGLGGTLTPLVGAAAFTRATTAAYEDDAGALLQVAAGEHRVRGGRLLLERQRTNKAPGLFEISEAAGATALADWEVTAAGATLLVVDDAAALAAAGLGVVSNGRVIEVTTGAEGGLFRVKIGAGQGVSNTSAHAAGVYCRRMSGAGRIAPRVQGSAPPYATPGATYRRYVSDGLTPANVSSRMEIALEPGTVYRFVIADLQEGGTLGTPILNAGSGYLTREAETLELPCPATYDAGVGVTIELRCLLHAAADDLGVVLTLDGDTQVTVSYDGALWSASTGTVTTAANADGTTSVNLQLSGADLPGGSALATLHVGSGFDLETVALLQGIHDLATL